MKLALPQIEIRLMKIIPYWK